MARSQVLNFADNFSATITTAAWRSEELQKMVGRAPDHAKTESVQMES
jgi:hypothetical protein